jgi:hypothetical protein
MWILTCTECLIPPVRLERCGNSKGWCSNTFTVIYCLASVHFPFCSCVVIGKTVPLVKSIIPFYVWPVPRPVIVAFCWTKGLREVNVGFDREICKRNYNTEDEFEIQPILFWLFYKYVAGTRFDCVALVVHVVPLSKLYCAAKISMVIEPFGLQSGWTIVNKVLWVICWGIN